MAIVERHMGTAAVRMEIDGLMLDPRERIVHLEGRKLMFTIPTIFDHLPLAAYSTVEAVLAAFDAKLVGRL